MHLLGDNITPKANLAYSLKRYGLWWAILLVTMAFDFLTTLYFVDKYGVDREANHLIRVLVQHCGLVAGVAVGKLLQLTAVIVVVGLHRRLGNLFLLVIILVNCWAVVMNSLI